MAETLDGNQLESTTVAINRTSTTVKGGRRLSFSALVVVGNRDGKVGIGYGKGRGVPVGIEKAQKVARKEMVGIKRLGATIPHEVIGSSCASTVKLIPAAPGTGVIAGGTVRAVLEMAGVRDCLTKAQGSTNKINLCRAVMDALSQLRTREEIAKLRGVEIERSTVDEALESTKRYMTTEGDAPKRKAKGPTNQKDEDAKKTRGRGGPRGGAGGPGGPGGGRGGNAGAPKAEDAKPEENKDADSGSGITGAVTDAAGAVASAASGAVGAVLSAVTGGGDDKQTGDAAGGTPETTAGGDNVAPSANASSAPTVTPVAANNAADTQNNDTAGPKPETTDGDDIGAAAAPATPDAADVPTDIDTDKN